MSTVTEGRRETNEDGFLSGRRPERVALYGIFLRRSYPIPRPERLFGPKASKNKQNIRRNSRKGRREIREDAFESSGRPERVELYGIFLRLSYPIPRPERLFRPSA